MASIDTWRMRRVDSGNTVKRDPLRHHPKKELILTDWQNPRLMNGNGINGCSVSVYAYMATYTELPLSAALATLSISVNVSVNVNVHNRCCSCVACACVYVSVWHWLAGCTGFCRSFSTSPFRPFV